MKSFRILLVSFIEDNRWSGMGKWSHQMAEGLKQLGHAPTLWFADEFPRVRGAGRFSILLFPLVLAFRLWRFRRDFDAIIIHEPSGFWYGLLRRVCRSLPPMISMCHNVESRNFKELTVAAQRGLATIPPGTHVKTPLLRLWQSDGAVRLSDHVVCLSTFDRDYIIRRLRRDPRQITLQRNGVGPPYFLTGRGAANGLGVLFVGGWLDVKGRRALPSIWSQVREKFPSARLTIVGSGLSAELVVRDFAERDRMSVTVRQRVSSETEIIAQYAAHDLFLMPSLSEGSPLSLLEALAAGLPAVAARVGGVADIIRHERDGLLFDSLNPSEGAGQVCRLLSDPALAARLGEAGQQRARSLSWESTARTLAGAVLKVVPQRSALPETSAGQRGNRAGDSFGPGGRQPS